MGTQLDRLAAAWNSPNFRAGRRNVLEADESVLQGMKPGSSVVYSDWAAYTKSDCFAKSDGKEFHLGLMPMPYLGNLREANVFLLSLNPGLGAHDYFGEHRVEEYRRELERNLRQEDRVRFPFLQPEHSWHGGSAYWMPRLREIVKGVGELGDLNPGRAMELCAERIAVVELVPYHSAAFAMSDAQVNQLESVRLVREFVFGELLPRQARGECKVIVLRARERWLPPCKEERHAAEPLLPMAWRHLNAYITTEDAREAAKMIFGR